MIDVMLPRTRGESEHNSGRFLLKKKKSSVEPGNQTLVSCQGRRGQRTTFVSCHWDRNTSPRWKDVKVSSPEEHSDNRRGKKKTPRVETFTWNRSRCCHRHPSGCNLGVALHFFFLRWWLERVGDGCVGWSGWRLCIHRQDVGLSAFESCFCVAEQEV